MQITTNDSPAIRVGIMDDHVSVASAFTAILNGMPGISAVLEVYSGQQLINQLQVVSLLPDILLMDVEMKEMSGIEATKWVTAQYPGIKVIAFSAKKDDWSVLQMISAGACAYLSKETPLVQLQQAIHEVYSKGKYQADLYHLNAAELRKSGKELEQLSFKDNEIRYLQLLCKGYTYEQMAEVMQVTVSGINYLRRSLCEKMNTKSLAIMVLEALRKGIVSTHEQPTNLK